MMSLARLCSISSVRPATDRASTATTTPVTASRYQTFPSLCSPQQILVVRNGATLDPLTDWIDVPAILRDLPG